MALNKHSSWAPNSWQQHTVSHLPFWQEPYRTICNNLISDNIFKTPIVTITSVDNLNNLLFNLKKDNGIILQMGDCAETFSQANYNDIKKRMDLIETLAKEFLNKKVIKLGRMAGQYSKPRHSSHESQNIYSYFGDMFNNFNVNERQLTPNNIITAYEKALFTYNEMQNINPTVYTSHEALNLFYEQALTKQVNGINYNLSAHMLWLGDRTRFLGSAHLEYLKGIANPIGIKLSSNISQEDFVEICKLLNPNNVAGKIIIINRMGVNSTSSNLANYIKTIKSHKLNVLYVTDPMHGNNTTINGIKTRLIADIKQEIKDFINIIKNNDEYFAGIHIETTADDALECDLISNLNQQTTFSKYLTTCDPRLNVSQALEVVKATATLIA